jgi:dolichol-phosphate mannosyltransferase
LKTLIVIPTYNEIENIHSIIEAVLQTVSDSVSVLIVDDGSPDGTGKVADDWSKKSNRVHVLHRFSKQGLGTAYVAGFKWGLDQGFDSIIEMDADFSHHPKYLPEMLKHLETHDFVLGSRNIPGGGTLNWGIGRKILSRGGSAYARLILSTPISDFTGGFNGWRRHVLESVQYQTLRSDGYSFQIELKYRAYRQGFSFKEFPIIFEDRKVGHSKMSFRIVIEALLRVWSFRGWKPAA